MNTHSKASIDNPYPGQLASTQINIVTTVDVAGVLREGSSEGRTFLMDNSPDSLGKGTAQLETVCRQGQVLNWLVYCMDMTKRPDGKWPPFAKIVNIVFLDTTGTSVLGLKVCADLKIYGGPDAIRHRYTPSYYYWAGAVLPHLTPGLYRYRLVVECQTGHDGDTRLFQIDGPALRVLASDHGMVA